MRKITILLLLAGLCSGTAGAEEICKKNDMTFDACRQAVKDALAPKMVAMKTFRETQAALKARKANADRVTGTDSTQSETGSNTTNLIPLVSALLGFEDELSEENGTVTLNFNPVLGSLGKVLQVQAKVKDPTIYSPLQEAIPEEMREEKAKELGKELTDLDDVTWVVSGGPSSKRWGRSFQHHSNEYSNLFLDSLPMIPEIIAVTAAAQALPPSCPDATEFQECGDKADEVRRKFEAAQKAEFLFDISIDEALEATRVSRFFDLLSNQPQLILSASLQERDGAAGPDDFSVKVTYEHGFHNLNSVRKECSSGKVDVTCFSGYVEKNDRAIKKGKRIAASVSYTETDPFAFQVPDTDISFESSKATSFVLSASYSQYLTFDKEGKDTSRLDLKLEYEDVSDDPNRQDRLVASGVWSQRLTDKMSIPFGLVYANHSRFLSDVDEQLSAHFGLVFNLGGEN